MHDSQTTLARRGPSKHLAAIERVDRWRRQCIAGAVLRVSLPFYGTVDGRVLGYDRIPGIRRPLKLEFQSKHGDKVIDRFTLGELKSLEVLAWE